MNNKDYITLYSTFAMEQMRRYGIPASVTLAQGILESSNGQSELARKPHSHGLRKAAGTACIRMTSRTRNSAAMIT